MIFYQPEKSSPLYKLWPEGVAGRVVHQALDLFHIRVKLPGHTAMNPSTAMIVVPKDRCEAIP
jgi:hypothetical protein